MDHRPRQRAVGGVALLMERSHLVDGVGWEDVLSSFEFGRGTANWHPLTSLSLALDAALFGLADAGHHGGRHHAHARCVL